VSTCRSCGARITWVRTESGKAMPIDVAPRADGNVGVTGGGIAVYLKADEQWQGPRYVSHFASCPQSARWRKPGVAYRRKAS
jgi:hypothetical protein